ncbi:MAG: hypothetical protein IMF11_07795 [Proteobacteria bacterium]|nr:hypothetical protein [Pseudomonadota bacterium]
MPGGIEEAKQKVEQELQRLEELSSPEKREKNENIKQMIKHYISLDNNVEDRRTRIYNQNLQFLGILFAALGLWFSFQNDMPNILFSYGLCVLCVQAVFSVLILTAFHCQSKFRFVFNFEELSKYGNKWKWFYYGNAPVKKLSERPIFVSKDPDETSFPYLEGLQRFIANYRAETIDNELVSNIQQLYLLQVHNYYKNRFYLQLVRLRLRSLLSSVGFTVGFFSGFLLSYL